MIAKRLDPGIRRVSVFLPYDRGALLDTLYREASVKAVDYRPEGIAVTAVCGPSTLGQVRAYLRTEDGA